MKYLLLPNDSHLAATAIGLAATSSKSITKLESICGYDRYSLSATWTLLLQQTNHPVSLDLLDNLPNATSIVLVAAADVRLTTPGAILPPTISFSTTSSDGIDANDIVMPTRGDSLLVAFLLMRQLNPELYSVHLVPAKKATLASALDISTLQNGMWCLGCVYVFVVAKLCASSCPDFPKLDLDLLKRGSELAVEANRDTIKARHGSDDTLYI
jgi:hypothetical protein